MESNQHQLHFNKLPKAYRLHGQKVIESLYKDGKGFFSHPFKVKYQLISSSEPAPSTQLLVIVPKRSFKKSVDRHRIKRLINEAWRLEHQVIRAHFDSHLSSQDTAKQFFTLRCSLQYVNQEVSSFDLIRKRVNLLLRKLVAELEQVMTASAAEDVIATKDEQAQQV